AAERIGDRVELLLARREEAAAFRADARAGAVGEPREQRIELGDRDGVVAQHRAKVGVGATRFPGAAVVLREERDRREAGLGGRRRALDQPRRRHGAGAEEPIAEAERARHAPRLRDAAARVNGRLARASNPQGTNESSWK